MRNKFRATDRYEVREEWTEQGGLIYAGLIGIGLIILQAFIAAGAADVPALISVLAFAVAIPLLATLVMLNRMQVRYKYASSPLYYFLAHAVGEGGAYIGVAAAFWHVSWIAGVLVSISGVLGLAIYIAYSNRLERDNPE